MEKKTTRDQLQLGIYKIINPAVRFLIRLGLTPNAVTLIGLLLNIGVAVVFVLGAEEGHRGDLSYVGWAGGLILFAGLFDMLDGQVARLGNMSSTFGALFDSVLDRYSELIMFLGICYYLVAHHYFLSSLFAFIALIGSMMVSYTRARAEGLGVESKGGLMQRPERVVLVSISAIACGVTAYFIGGDYKIFVSFLPFHIFETMTIFTLPVAVMAVLTNITAINRLRDAKKALDHLDRLQEQMKENEKKTKGMPVVTVTILMVLMSAGSVLAGNRFNEVDTFPVPRNPGNMMFYVQRTPNTNTIVYELNYREDKTLDTDNPIHVFWIRYQEGGKHKELNFIQRRFAYGLKTYKKPGDNWDLRMVAYQKHPLHLQKAADGKYYVFTEINDKQAVLQRIYIKIDGGTFWHPNVLYIELKGYDAKTGTPLTEQIKPS